MRPPAAKVHDQLWSGPIGRGRRAQFRLEQPDHRCCACSDWSTDDRTHIHHVSYKHFTGAEKAGTFVWLCPHDHRRVHWWHDRFFPRDKWPYRWLALTTRVYIAVRAPWRWITWGSDRTRYRMPPRSER